MIKSNIQDVIWRLKRLEAELPKAVGRAVGPKYWRGSLEHCARKELSKLWIMERDVALRTFYRRMTERIVATIMDEIFDKGVRYLLFIPKEALPLGPVSLSGAAQYNIGLRTPMGRLTKGAKMGDERLLHPEQVENLDRVRQLILDWVMTEKTLKPDRDYRADGTPYTPHEIAQRIEEILGISSGVVPGTRTALMQHAADELTRAIQSWIDGECATSPETAASAERAAAASAPVPNLPDASATLGPPEAAAPATSAAPSPLRFPPGVAEEWLATVLAAWKKLFLSRLEHRLDWEIFKTCQSVMKSKQDTLKL